MSGGTPPELNVGGQARAWSKLGSQGVWGEWVKPPAHGPSKLEGQGVWGGEWVSRPRTECQGAGPSLEQARVPGCVGGMGHTPPELNVGSQGVALVEVGYL